jgi:hypothetical protein
MLVVKQHQFIQYEVLLFPYHHNYACIAHGYGQVEEKTIEGSRKNNQSAHQNQVWQS